MPTTSTLHVTLSGDVYLKSRRTQKRLIERVLTNLGVATRQAGYKGTTKRIGTHRFELTVPTSVVEAVRAAALSVFGISSVDTVRHIEFGDIDDLARTVGEMTVDRVRGRTFAARVKRR